MNSLQSTRIVFSQTTFQTQYLLLKIENYYTLFIAIQHITVINHCISLRILLQCWFIDQKCELLFCYAETWFYYQNTQNTQNVASKIKYCWQFIYFKQLYFPSIACICNANLHWSHMWLIYWKHMHFPEFLIELCVPGWPHIVLLVVYFYVSVRLPVSILSFIFATNEEDLLVKHSCWSIAMLP